MAEYFSFNNIANSVGVTVAVIWLIIIIGGLVAVIWLVIWILMHKHKVHIMELTGTVIRHAYDKARIYQDRNGITWIKLLKRRVKDRVPPPEAKGLTKKGKYHFDLFYTEEGGYSFAYQDSQVICQQLATQRINEKGAVDENGNPIMEPVLDAKGKPIMITKQDENGNVLKDKNGHPLMVPETKQKVIASLVANLMPWTTADRNLYIQQQKERMVWKRADWMDVLNKHGGIIVTGMFVVIFMTVFMVMLGELMPDYRAAVAVRNQDSENMKEWAQSMEVVAKVMENFKPMVDEYLRSINNTPLVGPG